MDLTFDHRTTPVGNSTVVLTTVVGHPHVFTANIAPTPADVEQAKADNIAALRLMAPTQIV